MKQIFLNFKQRPADIQQKINEVFHSLSMKIGSRWTYNGAAEYNMCNLNEKKLVADIISRNPLQKTFKILEIGAGDFAWGDSLMQYLSEKFNLSSIKFEIFSIRGEQNSKLESRQLSIHDNLIHYRIGGFKIENLLEELEKHGFESNNIFNLIVSRSTLKHLVDPLGTFVQIYDSLAPHGTLLHDEFRFLFHNDNSNQVLNFNSLTNLHEIYQYLSKYNEVLIFNRNKNDPNEFMLVKGDHKELLLPMTYIKGEIIDTTSMHHTLKTHSAFIITFKDINATQEVKFSDSLHTKNFKELAHIYQGSKGLHESMHQHRDTKVEDAIFNIYKKELAEFGPETILTYWQDVHKDYQESYKGLVLGSQHSNFDLPDKKEIDYQEFSLENVPPIPEDALKKIDIVDRALREGQSFSPCIFNYSYECPNPLYYPMECLAQDSYCTLSPQYLLDNF